MSFLKNFKKKFDVDMFSKYEDEESSAEKIVFEIDSDNLEKENNEKREGEEKVENNGDKKTTTKKTQIETITKKIVSKKPLKNLNQIKMKSEEKSIYEKGGQLAIDLAQNEETFIIQATLAGIKVEDLDILIENDLVVIKGEREKPQEKKDYEYVIQECYWGPFSREIILPEEIKIDEVDATMKNGILIIKLPKLKRERRKKVIIKLKD